MRKCKCKSCSNLVSTLLPARKRHGRYCLLLRNLNFKNPESNDSPVHIGGLDTGMRWRELWLELRALRGKDYDPAMDLLLAIILWSGKSSSQRLAVVTCATLNQCSLRLDVRADKAQLTPTRAIRMLLMGCGNQDESELASPAGKVAYQGGQLHCP